MSLLKPMVAIAAIALVAAACTKKEETAADATMIGSDAASTGAVTPAPMPTDATGSVSSTGATGATGATAAGADMDSSNPVPETGMQSGTGGGGTGTTAGVGANGTPPPSQ